MENAFVIQDGWGKNVILKNARKIAITTENVLMENASVSTHTPALNVIF
jgi:hypothetical protein